MRWGTTLRCRIQAGEAFRNHVPTLPPSALPERILNPKQRRQEIPMKGRANLEFRG